MDSQQRYKLVACAVLNRECYHNAAIAKNIVDIHIIEQGLHDVGEQRMSQRLQQEIDNIDQENYDAILLGYGICNNGILGLKASIPLVVSRAHDCITLLMGSKEQYQKHFDDNPGTFYQSVGWTEQAKSSLSNPQSTTTRMGMLSTYQEYVDKYGEENAEYLMEMLGDHLRNYRQLTYIDTGVGDFTQYKKQSEEEAQERQWKYEEYSGNTELLLRMMNGEWDSDDFLVVPPGQTIKADYNGNIIRLDS